MSKYLLIFIFLCTISICGCLPTTSYHLQHFSSRLPQNSGVAQIESGRKDTYGESGISFTTSFFNNEIGFAEGSYFDNSRGTVDDSKVNSYIHFPAKTINAYGAFLSGKLISGLFEAQYGSSGKQRLYSFSGGLGVRLYKGPFAGRAFTSVGLIKVCNDVFLLQRNEGTDYDLFDQYSAMKPTLGATLAFNTRFQSSPVNPFVTVNFRANALFQHDEVYVGYECFSGIFGLYGRAGPAVFIMGCKCDLYAMNNKEIFFRPEMVIQVTFRPF